MLRAFNTLQVQRYEYNSQIRIEKGVSMGWNITRIVKILLMAGVLAMFALCNGG